jgi:protein gp37
MMAVDTGIEWARGPNGERGATWNPLSGCSPISPGCLNCYAATMSHRLEAMGQEKYSGLTVLHTGRRTFNGCIRLDEDALRIPLKRRKPTTYFVNSMSDLFHKDVPFEFIDKVFGVMALCQQHTFQVLTKRPERMAEYAYCRGFGTAVSSLADPIRESINRDFSGLGDHRGALTMPLPNVWLGTSVENVLVKKRIDSLRVIPAAIRFLSMEPLLGPMRNLDLTGIHWVIVGGESGPKSRPCEVDWIRSIVRQCKTAGVPVFVKQLGANPSASLAECGTDKNDHDNIERMELEDKKGGNPDEWPSDLRLREMPTTA